MSLFRAAWFKAAWFAAGWFGARGHEVQQSTASGAGFFVARRPSKRPYYAEDFEQQEDGRQPEVGVASAALAGKRGGALQGLPGAMRGPLVPQMMFRVDLRGFVFAKDGSATDDDLELIAAALAATL